MRTPAGIECRYFYGDYYRGRQHEECRLLPRDWQPRLCATCPVPAIRRANACEHMQLIARVERPLFVLPARVRVQAFCQKSARPVTEPHVGCGQCHTLPPAFMGAPDGSDPAA